MSISEDPMIIEFFQIKDLQPGTIRLYTHNIKHYSNFINLTPTQFIEQAEDDQYRSIIMRKRRIKNHILSFRDHLRDEHDYSELFIKTVMANIKTLYHHYDIQIPKISIRKKIVNRRTADDVPKIDHVKIALKYCNPKYKAILTLMVSSGMGRAEVISLKYSDFLDSIKEYVNLPKSSQYDIGELNKIVTKLQKDKTLIVPTWHVMRIKTKYNYITFSTPESVNKILDYLLIEPPKKIEDPLFRVGDHEIRPSGFSIYFTRLNKKCKFGKFDRQIFFRAHSLRSLFTNMLHRNKITKLRIDWYLGHKIKPVDEAYFKADLDDLKNEYMTCIEDLSVEKTEVHVFLNEDKKKLEDLKNEVGRLTKIVDAQNFVDQLPPKE